jgi:hypothetical protein
LEFHYEIRLMGGKSYLREVCVMGRRGPNTFAGKAAVRRNAVKHGLRAESPVVVEVESEEEWQRFSGAILESLAPVGDLEASLANVIALQLWRLRRVTVIEVAAIGLIVRGVQKDWDEVIVPASMQLPEPDRGKYISKEERVAFLKERSARLVASDERVLERIPRYEAHLHRQLIRTMHELEALQARRRGEVTPLGRVDVVE